MAGVFLQWRARKATAMLGRNWRSCGGSALHAMETKECKWSRQVRRASAGFHLELGRTTWRRRQSMRATRRSAPAPVGHGELCPFSEIFDSVFNDDD